MSNAETFLQQMAARRCERLTSREGCNGAHPEPEDRACDPCRARRITGDKEAARWCDQCGQRLWLVHTEWVNEDGGTTCRKHFPTLYYDEFTTDRKPKAAS
jgi:hypothetical protein